MNDDQRIALSKFLSWALRHEPGALGLTLGPGGWVEIDRLIAASAAHGRTFDRAEMLYVVETCEKQRFGIDPAGTRIRANQGHSTPVELELEVLDPPDVLYHGTATRFLDSIMAGGLKPMARHHVHLSQELEPARQVGTRHGKPVVLAIDARAMAADGFVFRRSANGVWLADEVPPRYLSEAAE